MFGSLLSAGEHHAQVPQQPPAEADRLRPQSEDQARGRGQGDAWHAGIREPRSGQLRTPLLEHGHVEYRRYHVHHVSVF